MDMGKAVSSDIVGFVGLGTMGRPMAANLIKAGHRLAVVDRPSLTEDMRALAEVCADLKALARVSSVIILMLPDTPDVEAVLFGANGLSGTDIAGKLVIDMSSISPTATKSFAEKLFALGCAYVDAPVSGGEVGAVAGSLTIMAGGPEEAFARALPLLEAMGRSITHIGTDNGAGQACKIANQMVVAMNIQAVAEALAFSQRFGVDPAKVREALLGGFAGSRVLDVHGKRMIEHTFAPGFRIALHHKDLRLALTAAEEFGATLTGTAVVETMFSRAIAAGGGAWDHSALMRIAEEDVGVISLVD